MPERIEIGEKATLALDSKWEMMMLQCPEQMPLGDGLMASVAVSSGLCQPLNGHLCKYLPTCHRKDRLAEYLLATNAEVYRTQSTDASIEYKVGTSCDRKEERKKKRLTPAPEYPAMQRKTAEWKRNGTKRREQ